MFSGRAAFVSEQNESFSLGGSSNGWDIGAIIKRRGKSAQDSLVVLKDCTLSHKVNTSLHASREKRIKILSGRIHITFRLVFLRCTIFLMKMYAG